MDDPWADEPSFDPRSWIVRAPVASPPPSSPPAPTTLTSTPAPARGVSRVAAGAIALALAGAGALVAHLAHPPGAVANGPSPMQVAPSGPMVETRTLMISDGADLQPSLIAAGIVPGEAQSAAHLVPPSTGKAGDLRIEMVMAPAPGGAHLRDLTVTRDDGTGAHVGATGTGSFAATPITARLSKRLSFVRGELDGESFYSSAIAAGVSDVLVSDFANAFRYDFDMQREVARGDVFEAGFEQRVTGTGVAVGSPVLVYASLSTAAKSRALYRFAPPNGSAEWVDASGRSSRRALMRTPVESARISSGFGFRNHPILGFMKLHKGTDFAAPTGTPIFAAGDATVEFAGPKGPNGNFVKLRHDNGWETLYLHMNRIWAGVAAGARVGQGQQIGEVGTTGRSTGPHLHYEIHIQGQPVDPMSIDTGSGRSLAGAQLARFRIVRDLIDSRRTAGTS